MSQPAFGGRPTPMRPAPSSAKRERPILELGAGGEPPRPGTLGPYGGHVRVIPITGLTRASFLLEDNPTLFEVHVGWYGPGLPGLPPIDRDVAAADTVTDVRPDLAEAIARAAAELLQAGRLPWLRHLKRALERDRASWRRRYEAEVGDGDRPG
jgi:hypothetical protein